jgi:hypothetical protein
VSVRAISYERIRGFREASTRETVLLHVSPAGYLVWCLGFRSKTVLPLSIRSQGVSNQVDGKVISALEELFKRGLLCLDSIADSPP